MKKIDYSEFKSINIFETKLIEKNKNTEKYFAQNGIYSLADLFTKDDEGLLLPKGMIIHFNVKELIRFARYKYLNQDLLFEIDPSQRLKKDVIFYTKSDEDGKEIGKVKSKNVDRDFSYGIRLSYILETAYSILGDEFSIEDILTNPAVISKIKNSLKQNGIGISKFLLVCDYIEKHKKNREMIDESDDIKALLEEERRLLEELVDLNNRSAKIAFRISEIRKTKDSREK